MQFILLKRHSRCRCNKFRNRQLVPVRKGPLRRTKIIKPETIFEFLVWKELWEVTYCIYNMNTKLLRYLFTLGGKKIQDQIKQKYGYHVEDLSQNPIKTIEDALDEIERYRTSRDGIKIKRIYSHVTIKQGDIVSSEFLFQKLIDISNGEFAKFHAANKSKYYNDKLKAVLAAKCHLNYIIESSPWWARTAIFSHYQSLIRMFTLCKKILSISYPRTYFEVSHGGIASIIDGFELIEDIIAKIDKKGNARKSIDTDEWLSPVVSDANNNYDNLDTFDASNNDDLDIEMTFKYKQPLFKTPGFFLRTTNGFTVCPSMDLLVVLQKQKRCDNRKLWGHLAERQKVVFIVT
ncbi:hypothetical protein EDC94DRAFT_582458 [Helicostylum pulchrum]|nr:hypothetical protein EDC94DRAFT_582458 [Helicostylum pulchrum]